MERGRRVQFSFVELRMEEGGLLSKCVCKPSEGCVVSGPSNGTLGGIERQTCP